MRSYEQLIEYTVMQSRPRSRGSEQIKRQDSCIFSSDPPQSSRTIMRPHKPSSLSPAIPAFQAALSKWSPPPSPGSLPPGSTFPNAASPGSTSPNTASPGSVSPGRTLALPAGSQVYTPSQLAHFLYTAACAGDFPAMQSAIRQGASVNCSVLVPGIFEAFKPAKSGHLSPLAGAASHGQLRAVKFLVSRGAEISPCTTRSASSPLHQACRSNNLPIVQFLLHNHADVDVENAYKVTPVMYACKYSSREIVSLLLQYAPDLSKVSFIGSTALNWACFAGRADIAELLLRAGADPNQAMPDGNTSLHCAVLTGSASMVKAMLRNGADPFLRNEANDTALQLAERQPDSTQIVAMLRTVIAMCQQKRR